MLQIANTLGWITIDGADVTAMVVVEAVVVVGAVVVRKVFFEVLDGTNRWGM